MISKPLLITDFTNLSKQKWQIVNDDVMGGLSDCQLLINFDGDAVFLGRVSLENNGGFASVKNHEPVNLNGCESIRIHLKGDGKRYSFRLQSGHGINVHPWSYEHRFNTKRDLWMEINLPINKFTATFRGSKPENAPELDLSAIGTFGFLISDKQEGEFRLEVDKIEAL
jgi:NADH dehydrogenase [ubiquinone] 1 alpha subcomplex assembly factor 1